MVARSVFSITTWQVRMRGLEPPRPEGHQILNLACLPFHHTRSFPDVPGKYPTRDSNPHARKGRQPLKLVRLPVPPVGRGLAPVSRTTGGARYSLFVREEPASPPPAHRCPPGLAVRSEHSTHGTRTLSTRLGRSFLVATRSSWPRTRGVTCKRSPCQGEREASPWGAWARHPRRGHASYPAHEGDLPSCGRVSFEVRWRGLRVCPWRDSNPHALSGTRV